MADFEIAVQLLLANEGGYVNDPTDPGGETKYGISKRQFPHIDIQALTVIEAQEIYRKEYWLFDDVSSQAVANKLLDMNVNLGNQSIRLLQKILGVSIDGQFGPRTLATTNLVNPDLLLQSLRIEQLIHYAYLISQRPSLFKYARGWIRRALN